ncbi:MAG: hypothetical protein ACFFER_04870 [Candidatus Thorarchaeota archaeon]
MQEQILSINIPALLALGFLIGILLVAIGYREKGNPVLRAHRIGLGVIIIGIMIPATPLAWYGSWALITGIIVLGILDIVIIILTLIVGFNGIYYGFKTYRSSQ